MPVKKFKDPFKLVGNHSSKKDLKAPKTASGSELSLNTSVEKSSSISTFLTGTGGSTYPRYNKDILKERWNTLSGRLMDYLLEKNPQTGLDNLELLLRETKLKDIGILLGISTEKVLLMEGAPTSIIGHAEGKKLDELLPALLDEVKRRGAKIELTERKAQVKLDK